MKIAFPTMENKGIDSPVYGHFGSAYYFVFLDEKTGNLEIKENPDREHEHGFCKPLAALGGEKVDAVVVGGIGGGALKKLMTGGIKVYRAVEGSVKENADLIKAGNLPLFTPSDTCGHHVGIGDSMDGGGCDHS